MVAQLYGGRPRPRVAFDVLVALAIVALVFGVARLGAAWRAPARAVVAIDLSPWALPAYALYSLSRGLIAYALSLIFTLVYGYWAAKSRAAERVLVPMLDVLQSIPVLGFMPALVLGLVGAFPSSNVGLELAAILMIFTGQAWNMTFSFYYSVKSVPADQIEVTTTYRFTWWQRLRWVELPFATIGLLWNSMMSMAGGWFFLMISEAFVLGDKDFRLPGVGSYMSVAAAKGDARAMVWAVVAMTLMIVALDQILWRPAVVWAQKFRVEEGGQGAPAESWMLDLLRRSHLPGLVARLSRSAFASRRRARPRARRARPRIALALQIVPLAALAALMIWGGYELVILLAALPAATWLRLGVDGALTLARVLASTALGTAWALPAGLAIGLSPRLSRVLQPVVQVVASFPAPMLFPIVIVGLRAAGVSLGFGSVALMLLGTQWYILFNVIAGASAMPSDLREAAKSYRLGAWQRFRALYLPAVFPPLVTGWITATGGAWNASIVSEMLVVKGETLATRGLGAQVSDAAARGDFPRLAASVALMAAIVVLFHRAVWTPLHHLAETRFSLSK
ncbi:MAG: ABC transporter permease subunit [Polyangiaceae bacterium]